ncbi:hypothetical protein CCAL9344_00395 [Campylobacter sp. RM9344]|uniref:Uncharacterized protein n=1 Tax=Campylobacter californiensis TaxID=1032243 RepID=A0AAW3ZVD3_9BACT|nr:MULTISPECIES: hypothetical protein [unclassified Campylobacter]MBE2983809.1 hypothetical protein [Campylobacter sp. RM6883]MBE2994347.1 hypothetical protein [Campylobacter sp. RM6913]MBE3022193.1 hypothetical protein [Campylobacter sp. 7477a]MBE3028655.1 hypothetical protein [Campylobacter sp. RM9344]MBE3605437.1 hypothetical protein [Campylobacter sp. RM13119]
MDYFKDWQKFSPKGATVDFFKTQKDDEKYIGFDTRACVPPEPMLNAMLALKFADKNTKIVMINHKFPAGLIPKIEKNFYVISENLEGEQVKLTFSLKDGASLEGFDFNQTCHG